MVNTISQNNEIDKDNNVIAFLVEQYGEKVESLLDKINSSQVKLRYKDEKDELAQEIEMMHKHPIESNYKMAQLSRLFLSDLIHDKLIQEIFSKR